MSKKELSIRELSKIVNVSEGTIRSWTLKPIEGKVYKVGDTNYESLRQGLRRYFDDKTFEKRFEFKIDDVIIIKGVSSKRDYVEFNDLEVGKTYDLHNYSFVTELTLYLIHEFKDSDTIYVFKGEKGYKTYTIDELLKPNIRFVLK